MFWHYLGLSTLFPFIFGSNKSIAGPEADKGADTEVMVILELTTVRTTQTAVNDEPLDVAEEQLAPGEAIEVEEPFPLLDLPPELIAKVLRHVPITDRLRARLEAGEEYSAGKMVIAREMGPGGYWFRDEEISIKMRGPRSALVPAVAKLASNVRMQYVRFKCEHPADLLLIPHVQSIRTDRLSLSFWNHTQTIIENLQNPDLGPREMTDANIDEWIGETKFLSVNGGVGLTGERLFSLYNDMKTHRSPLLSLHLHDARVAESSKVLQLLGINYVNEQFHTSRKDVYLEHLTPASSMSYGYFFLILGSKMKITISKTALGLPTWNMPSEFSMERHNEDGSVPRQWEGNYSFFLSIEDIRMQTKRFGRVPVIYSN